MVLGVVLGTGTRCSTGVTHSEGVLNVPKLYSVSLSEVHV